MPLTLESDYINSELPNFYDVLLSLSDSVHRNCVGGLNSCQCNLSLGHCCLQANALCGKREWQVRQGCRMNALMHIHFVGARRTRHAQMACHSSVAKGKTAHFALLLETVQLVFHIRSDYRTRSVADCLIN